MTHMIDFKPLIDDFIQVARLAGAQVTPEDITLNVQPAPHTTPPSFSKGSMAVYVFVWGDRCLKVGKAGSKSGARFRTQHYSVSAAKSTLAKSLVDHQALLQMQGLSPENIEAWMFIHTTRINLTLPAARGIFVLSLLEAFLQCRLNPMFEGFRSQRELAEA